ncbi:hypothetical protein [Lentzea californiensis]|uniref:hypothetical protein n=1 Tax=Lentzea californiensis TaxID=438851 RepID=UPI00216666E7|nr:hypothetical protein [Lentzea californiensis]MCR3753750.1 hypothetical protein [Lentzea californiensis]
MEQSLVLTFAELEFLLRVREPEIATIREDLGLAPADDAVAAAGLASLLARGLCEPGDGGVVPVPELRAVVAALATADRVTRVLDLGDGSVELGAVVTGPNVHIGLTAVGFGQHVVQPIDVASGAAEQVRHVLGRALGRESAVLVQSRTARGQVSIAIAIDGEGAWYLSDSEGDPDRGTPVGEDEAHARVAELLADPVGVR